MKEKKHSDEVLRILVIIRLDAQRLFERIKYRELEYMHHFSAKRTREHFSSIFKSKYDQFTLENLKNISEEVNVGIDQFYHHVDEMRWYLMVTEDMPGKVQERVDHFIHEIEQAYEILQLYISVELGLQEKPEVNDEEDDLIIPIAEDIEDLEE